MTLDDQRNWFLADIARDRRASRWVRVPQFGATSAAGLVLAVLAAYGLWAAIGRFRGGGPADDTTELVGGLVGGGSGALGFAVVWLVGRTRELSNDFLRAEERYTAFTARARAARTVEDYIKTITDYERVRPPGQE